MSRHNPQLKAFAATMQVHPPQIEIKQTSHREKQPYDLVPNPDPSGPIQQDARGSLQSPSGRVCTRAIKCVRTRLPWILYCFINTVAQQAQGLPGRRVPRFYDADYPSQRVSQWTEIYATD